MRMSPDPGHTPEWVSTTIVDATHITETGEARPVRLKVGLVQVHEAGVRVASQVEGRDLFLLPPASVARIIGSLSRGLRNQ